MCSGIIMGFVLWGNRYIYQQEIAATVYGEGVHSKEVPTRVPARYSYLEDFFTEDQIKHMSIIIMRGVEKKLKSDQTWEQWKSEFIESSSAHADKRIERLNNLFKKGKISERYHKAQIELAQKAKEGDFAPPDPTVWLFKGSDAVEQYMIDRYDVENFEDASFIMLEEDYDREKIKFHDQELKEAFEQAISKNK